MATLVFAADTLIRFKQGRILIHTTSSALRAFESDSPMLVGWLCQFSKPTDMDRALGALQPQDRSGVLSVVDYLQRSGALVEAGSPATGARTEAETSYRVKQHLRLLARSFYEAACDVLSFGPRAEEELQKRSGAGIERRLTALLAATDGLRSELGQLRQTYVSEQLAKLNVRPGDKNLKLHIGCGKGLLDGWVNIDVFPAPLALNVQWGLPFADASARCIFVSHLLEHLYYPKDTEPFLNEIRRVLAPGGIVRIVVPDIEQCIEAYVKNDRSFFGNRRETWPWWPENPTRLEDFLAYAGAGADPGWLFESHKFGYDFETLSRLLSNAGMCDIKRSGYMESEHADLQVDHVSAVAKAKYGDRYYSLFVEAARPEAAPTA
jgi:predicted SAM-dependent methyltransferase